VEIKNAAANTTFDANIEVNSDGTKVVKIGTMTTDSLGEGTRG